MRVRKPAGANLVALALMLAAAGTGAAGAYGLTGATLTEESDRAVLEITASEPPRFEVIRLSDPDRVVIDLLDADRAVDPSVSRCGEEGWLTGIRHSLWRDDPSGRVVRYVLETGQPMASTVEEDGCTIRVLVHRDGASGAAISLPQAEIASESALDMQASASTEQAEADAPATDAPHAFGAPAALDAAALPDPVVLGAAAPPAPAATPAADEPTPMPPIDTAPAFGHADPSVPVAAGLAAGGESGSSNRGAPMNLDAQGADIRTVLRSISEFGKVNIIADRNIGGPISLHLVQVPWRDALDIVCASAALSTVEGDGVIRVADRKTVLEEEIEEEAAARKKEELLPLGMAILPVKYANAEELKQSLSFALSKRGSLEVDARTNSILVTDIEDRIGQIQAMVEDLDTETLQVEIVARMVDVDVTASRMLGISWNVQNLHSNAERISGSISHDTEIVNAATELKFGLIRPFGNIDGVIQALEQENKANLLANPSITTVNNRKARILVGKEVPLIILDEAGNPITELKKVGVTLEVTPYINSESRITMDLHPEVSDLSSQATVQGGIVFTTTEADTRIMVADGETAVIGGLISEGETRFEEGVPILRSIPLIGGLFRTSEVRKSSRELMIFVTPRIVRSMAAAETP